MKNLPLKLIGQWALAATAMVCSSVLAAKGTITPEQWMMVMGGAQLQGLAGGSAIPAVVDRMKK